MKIYIILLSVLLMGCASLHGTASITETDDGVKFEASRPTKMTMKDGEKEYTFDSQSQSLLSRVMSALALGGGVGAGR